MSTEFTNEQLQSAINKNNGEAEELIKDPDKMEEFLQKLERKLEKIPFVGNLLSDVPLMISFVRAYIKKEYTDVPVGTIIGIVGALIYLLSPIDLIPDFIPAAGYLDDAAVIGFVYKMVHDDLNDYKEWREKNN